MNQADLESWKKDPATVKILGMMERYHQRLEEEYKNRWFYGVPVTDEQLAQCHAYKQLLVNMQTITFADYEKLKDELNDHQRH